MGHNQPKPKPDLSEDDICSAIEAEGYPFEIRVFEKLRELAMDPVFGERVPTGEEGETRDTDVIGFREVEIPRQHGRSYATFELVTEAKKIHGGAFVGFLASHTDADEVAFQRMRVTIGGSPSFGVLPGYQHEELVFAAKNPAPLSTGLISEAIAPLARGVPHCVQWGLPRRAKNKERGEFTADHDPGVYDDLIGATRTAEWLLRRATETVIGQKTDTAVYQTFALPVLALDGRVFTYDVTTKRLERVHHLALQICADGHTGTRRSIVDVVDFEGLASLVGRINESAEIASRVLADADYAHALAMVGAAHRRVWEENRLKAAVKGGVRWRPAGALE